MQQEIGKTDNLESRHKQGLSDVQRLVMWLCRLFRPVPPVEPPSSLKTRDEMDEMMFHAPVRKAIAECKLAGCSKDICDNAWESHLEKCKARGIGLPT